MPDDLNRPLGLHRPPVKQSSGILRGRRTLGLVAAIAILAGSAATAYFQPALLQADFQADASPAAPAVETAVTRAPLSPPAAEPASPARPRTQAPVEAGITVGEPSALRQEAGLAHMPETDLLEDSAFGPLPIRAPDGRRPLDVYSAQASGAPGPRVAIVIGGLGISQTGTQSAIEALPPGVTLAFAAAGNSLNRWMQEARRKGHEILLQVPLEPVGYPATSPGPHTLTAADASAGRLDELLWSLGRLTNYVGVMNYMGGRFTAEAEAMRQFLSETGRRGLLYLDDASSSRSLAEATAAEAVVPFAGADILLDASQQPEAIRRQLDELERVARAQGSAIAVASAFESSVQAVSEWVTGARARGIAVVPVSALATDPESR